MPSKVVIDGAAVQALLRSEKGPVMRDLMARATRFQAAVRTYLEPHNKTECLSKSIVKRFKSDGTIEVQSDTSSCSSDRRSYSLDVHEGTEAHLISGKDGALSFYWENGPLGAGRYFYHTVHHPGTKPIRFFTDNLHALG